MENIEKDVFMDSVKKLNKGGWYTLASYKKRQGSFSFIAIISLCVSFLGMFFLRGPSSSELPIELTIGFGVVVGGLSVFGAMVIAMVTDLIDFRLMTKTNKKRGEECFEASKRLYEGLKSKGVAVSGHGSAPNDDGRDFVIRISLNGDKKTFDEIYLLETDPKSGFQVKYKFLKK